MAEDASRPPSGAPAFPPLHRRAGRRTSRRSPATASSPRTRRSSAASAAWHGRSVMVIGHEKGSDTEGRIKHNFGMARPEGYRKAVAADGDGRPLPASRGEPGRHGRRLSRHRRRGARARPRPSPARPIAASASACRSSPSSSAKAARAAPSPSPRRTASICSSTRSIRSPRRRPPPRSCGRIPRARSMPRPT